MNGTHVPAAPGDVAEEYVVRIEAHLVRLAEGHDPIGLLLGIERLARSAGAEWWETYRAAAWEWRGP